MNMKNETKLINLINSNGGYHGGSISIDNGFTIGQLEAILEFGNHLAFADEQEIVFTPTFNENQKGRISISHHPLPSKTWNKFRDQKLAKKLGGFRMVNTVNKISNVDAGYNKRYNQIKSFLKTFPEKFQYVVNDLINNDLAKLSEFTVRMHTNTMFRYATELLHIRATEKGVIFSQDELLSHGEFSRKGSMSYKSELRSAGFLVNTPIDVKIRNTIDACTNQLFKLKEDGLINCQYMNSIKSVLHSLPERAPKMLNARVDISLPLILMSIYYIEHEKVPLNVIVKNYTDIRSTSDYETLYQQTYRILYRSHRFSDIGQQLQNLSLDHNYTSPLVNGFNDTHIGILSSDEVVDLSVHKFSPTVKTVPKVELDIKIQSIANLKPASKDPVFLNVGQFNRFRKFPRKISHVLDQISLLSERLYSNTPWFTSRILLDTQMLGGAAG